MNIRSKSSPTISVAQLAVLLLATANLYLFYWFFRTATELKTHRELPLTPWHWALAPLLGPFMVFPMTRMASYLKDWQVDEHRRIAHLAEPALLAMLILCAFLTLLMLVLDPDSLVPVLVTIALLLMIPPLALQGQLRLNESREQSRTTMAGWQLATTLLGSVAAIPLYVYAYTNVFELRGSRQLGAGTVTVSETGTFQVRTADTAWRQVRGGYLSEESSLEFLGLDDYTYAIVYDSSGLSADEIVSYRVESSLDDYYRADCTQRKLLLPGTLTVEGFVECKGRSPIEGDYVLIARSLVNADTAVEIVAATSQFDAAAFRARRQDIDAIIKGLELIEQ